MKIRTFIIFLVLLSGCENIAQGIVEDTENELIKGRGAIRGQFTGKISDRSFSLKSIDTDSIITLDLMESGKFTIVNLVPGYYRLQEEYNAVNTLLDSVPVRADSLTILETINRDDNFYHGWVPPPPPDRVYPQGNIKHKIWTIVPINNIVNH